MGWDGDACDGDACDGNARNVRMETTWIRWDGDDGLEGTGTPDGDMRIGRFG